MTTQFGITGAGPHEGKRECSNRCEMDRCDKAFQCAARGCNKDHLCEGCTYICAKCDQDFCVGHVTDLNLGSADLDSLYFCRRCVEDVVTLCLAKVATAVEVAA